MAPLQIPTEARPTRERILPAASPSRPKAILQPESPAPRRELPREPRRVRIALAGCGVVGGGLVRLLHEKAPSIAARFDVQFDLTGVLVRDVTRTRNLPVRSSLFTDDLEEFLSREADVVVEAVGGHEPARAIASHALSRGRKFITANKDLIAVHGISLARLAEENGAGLDFGAAVGGSAPIISTLRDVLGASTPTSVRGILNGTSNYVISQVERGIPLDAALAAACSKGLAELDCCRDLDGRDAAAKLEIIAWVAFGVVPGTLPLRRTALPADLSRLVHAASLLGGRLRLVAECTQLPDNKISGSVEPTIVAANSGFGRTHLEENRLEVDLGWGAPLAVSGAGAGGVPTATALLADLVGAARPRNEPGVGATRFTAVADERRHRWVLSALLPSDRVETVAIATGVGVERCIPIGSSAALVTRPVTWREVTPLIEKLTDIGEDPSVARYELPGGGEEC